MCEVGFGQNRHKTRNGLKGRGKKSGQGNKPTNKQKNRKWVKIRKYKWGWEGVTNRLHSVEKTKGTRVRKKAQRGRPT